MIDAIIQYSLLGYAVMSCASIAGSNIFIALATLAALIKTIKDRGVPSFVEPKLFKAVGIFLAAMLLSAAFSPDIAPSLNKVWGYASRMFPMVLVMLFIRDTQSLFVLLVGVVFSLTAADLVAIWQGGVLGNFRAPAFAAHPMIFAGYLVQVIGLLLVMIEADLHIGGKYRIIFSISLFLSLLALLFNGTRGAWFAVAVIIVVFSFQHSASKKRWLAACLLVFLCLGMLFTVVPDFRGRVLTLTDESVYSNSERLLLWQSSLQMFVDHPIVGIGIGNFLHAYTTHYISPLAVERGLGHAHNNFFQMLADAGIVGLLSFLYLYYVIVKLSYRNYKHNASTYSLILLLATAGLLLQGLTEFNFGDSAVIRLYWFLTGIGFSAAAYQNNSSRYKR